MRHLLTLLAIIIVAFGFFEWMTHSGEVPVLEPVPQMHQYEDARYGIALEYPDTYVLDERDELSGERAAHHIVLMPASELPLPEAGEGPPAITIDLYQNDLDHYETESWIRSSSFSNFKLGEGRLASTTLGGEPALSYRWSGLYEGTTIALARPQWVYALSVTYREPGEDIVQDFVHIRDSVRFIK